MQIVDLVKHEFPQARLLLRSYDRGHAVELIRAGVDYQIRETVESAYLMGRRGCARWALRKARSRRRLRTSVVGTLSALLSRCRETPCRAGTVCCSNLSPSR